MKFQGVLPILLILTVIVISTASAKKSGKDRKSTTTSTETSLSLENGDKGHEGLSAELLGLKEHATNVKPETSSLRPREKKPKHRRKNKHHRGPHRQKKNRTKPTDILRAEDDKVPNTQMLPSGPTQASLDSMDNEKLPVPRSHRKGKNKHGQNRGTRHLGLNSDNSPRKFTNGHHGGLHEQSEMAAKQHRRRRIHHKKHKKSHEQNGQKDGGKLEVVSSTLL